jgi:threonine dehydratase
LAYAASLLGNSAAVVMSYITPPNKVNAAKGYVAKVVLTEGGLLATCLEVQKKHNLTFVHPFDGPT